MHALRKTWESGEQLRGWCRMDEEYIIACINGPCYANVIPVQKVVWAYKSVTQVNAVIKTDTSLIAFEGAAGMSLPGKEYHAGKQTG